MTRMTAVAAFLATSTALVNPAAAEIELTMYYPIAVGGKLTEVVDGIVARFEEQNPDINVNAIYAGNYDDTRIKALAALDSGESAQLAVMFSIDAYDLIEQDHIVAFDDLIQSDEEQAWLDGFYPALMANGKIEGKTWGVPFQRSTIVAYYNKDMFRAAGLDPEKAPTTWDELVEMGKALTNDDHHGLMIPSTGYPYWMFQALAIQNGKELMSNDGVTTYFDDADVVDTLGFWKSLSTEHGIMPEGTVEWGAARGLRRPALRSKPLAGSCRRSVRIGSRRSARRAPVRFQRSKTLPRHVPVDPGPPGPGETLAHRPSARRFHRRRVTRPYSPSQSTIRRPVRARS